MADNRNPISGGGFGRDPQPRYLRPFGAAKDAAWSCLAGPRNRPGTTEKDTKKQIVLLGIMGYLFYGYGMWVIERMMPALIIVAILTIRNKGLGLLLTPVLFIKGFTMLFSVGLGGLIAPLYGQTASPSETWFYISLSIVFLVTTVLHLWNLKTGDYAAPKKLPL